MLLFVVRAPRASRRARLSASLLPVVLASLNVAGCGSDAPKAQAGSAGEGGSRGFSVGSNPGGAAGRAGNAGGAGKGGAGSAGKSGQAGEAGTGGKPGGAAGAPTGGSSGEAGAAGMMSGGACQAPSDCPGQENECSTRTCEAGKCGVAFLGAGKPVANQTAGDCVARVCDGAGKVVVKVDLKDVPDDKNPCTLDVCTGDQASHGMVAAGTSCGPAQTCDGKGKCVGCTTAADCPGTDDICQQRTCVASVCSLVFTPASTPLSDDTAGDCVRRACDGQGNLTVLHDALDVPLDATVCTRDRCENGVPKHDPATAGSMCEGGGVCTDSGACVACITASTCPGQDDECQARTCENNVCGLSFVAKDTPVLGQTSGDCGELVCDGAGKTVRRIDPTDIDDDDNVCTKDACTNGVSSHTPVAVGTACGNAQLCDAAGRCVGCVTAEDCAGTDDACKARTCVDSICGFEVSAAGTRLPDTKTGDCRVRTCDGNGKIVEVIDANDVLVDGNVCSHDVCINGSPQNPAVPAGRDCGGGKICSGTGACVQCVTAATCPGQDTACQTRTCQAGVCGLAFTASQTPVPSQVTGDCAARVCDGAGKIVKIVDALDVPVDGNGCTSDLCVDGAPKNPPVAAGERCGESGVCDGNAACVGCVQPTDCPGSDDECKRRTCVANVCGVAFTANGTKVSAQSPHDCQANVCDGAGGIVLVTDTADVPADDGLACTIATCDEQTPTHAPAAAGAACPFNGQPGVCDGAGACACAGGTKETVCNDGKDDDCDGQVDCADADCAAACAPPTLFFSEYVEGSGQTRALELFNPGKAAFPLTNCRVRIYVDGSATISSALDLETLGAAATPALTEVGPGKTLTLCYAGGAVPAAQCDLTTNSAVLDFTGNDALDLICGNNRLDVIGQVGTNPGAAWGTPPTSTENATLRRKCGIYAGDAVGTDPFEPGVQWDGLMTNAFDGLGARGCP